MAIASSFSFFNANFGPKGAEILAAALPRCPLLTHVNLGYNMIGDEGAEHLATGCSNAQVSCT